MFLILGVYCHPVFFFPVLVTTFISCDVEKVGVRWKNNAFISGTAELLCMKDNFLQKNKSHINGAGNVNCVIQSANRHRSTARGRTTQRTKWYTRGQERDLGWCWPLLVQSGLLDQPQWGCNLGAMGTEECPSAGEWAAD